MLRKVTVTIGDVARAAGVAISTASDILNRKLKAKPETVQRVQWAARELGYRPNRQARSMRTQKTDTIGLVVPFRRPLFTSALLTDLLSGIQAAQAASGLNLMLASAAYRGKNERYGADLVEAAAVDGVIVIGTRETYGRAVDKDVSRLRKLGCPLVWLHHYEGKAAVDRILRAVDSKQVFDEICALIRSRGHRRVGLLEPGIHPSLNGKFDAFEKTHLDAAKRALVALQAQGFETRPDWMVCGEVFDGGAFRAALRLLNRGAKERPAVLICHGDDLAVAALQAALGLGLQVPRDLALISTSQLSVGEHAAVPLTTYGAPATELGKAAVLRLKSLIMDRTQPPETRYVPGGLVLRASI